MTTNPLLRVEVHTFNNQIPKHSDPRPCIVIDSADELRTWTILTMRERVIEIFVSEHSHLKPYIHTNGQFFFRYQDTLTSCYHQFSLALVDVFIFTTFQAKLLSSAGEFTVKNASVHFIWNLPIKVLTTNGHLHYIGQYVYESRQQGSLIHDTTKVEYIKKKLLHQSCLDMRLNTMNIEKDLLPSYQANDYDLYFIKDQEPYGLWSVKHNMYPLEYESIVHRGCSELCVAVPSTTQPTQSVPTTPSWEGLYMWYYTYTHVDIPSLLKIQTDYVESDDINGMISELEKQYALSSDFADKCATFIEPLLDGMIDSTLGIHSLKESNVLSVQNIQDVKPCDASSTSKTNAAVANTATNSNRTRICMNLKQVTQPFLVALTDWVIFKSITTDCKLPTTTGDIEVDYFIESNSHYPVVVVCMNANTDEELVRDGILGKLFPAMHHVLTTPKVDKVVSSSNRPTTATKPVPSAVTGVFISEIPGSQDPTVHYYYMHIEHVREGSEEPRKPVVLLLGKSGFEVVHSQQLYNFFNRFEVQESQKRFLAAMHALTTCDMSSLY